MILAKKSACFLIISLLFLSAFLPVIGQNNSRKADAATLKLIREVTPEQGNQTGAVIIQREIRITINEKGQRKVVLRTLGKVFTKEAMSDYSQIPLSFNSYYETPTLNYARVIHADGTVREVPKDAVQIKTAPEAEGLQYTDAKYLSFALSGMEPGAAFDYQVTFDHKASIIEGEWFDNHLFVNVLRNLVPPYYPRIDPVITSLYTLVVAKNTKFQYRTYSGAGEPKKRTIGGEDEYQWVQKNIPSVAIEDAMPAITKLCPAVIVTSIDNWQEIDAWASKKFNSRVEVTGEVAEKAQQLAADRKTDEEKIKAIANFIQTNIQYIYADLDRGGYEPHFANEILKSRYGDCKDQSILLISMLKAVGIDAYPVFINPFPYDEPYDVPIPLFTHLITYIPKGDIWLDMTSGVTPFPNLYFMDQGRTAFIIDGKGGRLVKTPVSSGEKNVSTFDLQTSFSGGTLNMKMKIVTGGVPSDVYKSVFKQVNIKDLEESLKMMIRSFADDAVFDTLKISDIHNPDIPLSIDISYHLDSVWENGQGEFNYGSHTLFPLTMLASIDAQSFPAKRTHDVIGAYKYMVTGTERYVAPRKDMVLVTLPSGDSVQNGLMNFRRSFSKEGNVAIANWTLAFPTIEIPKEKYETYVSGIRLMREKAAWELRFVEPGSYIPGLIKSETTDNILSYCNELVKEDPKNVMAYLLRGMVYNKSRQFDQAIKAFQEVMKIDPSNKYAYLYCALPLMAKKSNVLAAQNIEKALQIDPDFESALMLRSAMYADQGMFDKALADLDRVHKVNPQNVYSLETKATLLAKMGKEMESLAVLEEAVKTDTTNVDFIAILADTYMSKNQYMKAIDFYEKLIKINSNNTHFYGNLGWAYYMVNNDKKCIENSKKAIEIDPTAYYARYNLGLANLRSGNIDEARRIYGELKKEKDSITESSQKGAIKDLNDLKAKGVYVKEIKAILKDFFGI